MPRQADSSLRIGTIIESTTDDTTLATGLPIHLKHSIYSLF
jgi:hypothetical protein